MKIKVNNKEMQGQYSTLAQLISTLNLPDKGIAVAVNQTMVPRNQWSEYALEEGAEVLIIKAVCGG